MDENENLEVEAELSEEDEKVFDDSWDEDTALNESGSSDLSEETEEQPEDAQPEEPEEEEDGDNPEESQPEETEDAPEKQGEEAESGHQRFKINHLGKEEELTLEEMTTLAQKGKDYDHVREERDSLRQAKDDASAKLAFLEDLAKRSGVTVEEQMERTRALWLQVDEADNGNDITEEEALERIRADAKKAKEAKESKEKEANKSPSWDDQVDRFLSVYPDVKAEDIPTEVWVETKKLGGDLLSAYQAYEIKKLREQVEKSKTSQKKEELNEKNKNRSTGPRRSAGAGKVLDSFDEGWGS